MADQEFVSVAADPPNGEAAGESVVTTRHSDLVPPETIWWWIAIICVAIVTLVANFVFLLTVIYNRYVRK